VPTAVGIVAVGFEVVGHVFALLITSATAFPGDSSVDFAQRAQHDMPLRIRAVGLTCFGPYTSAASAVSGLQHPRHPGRYLLRVRREAAHEAGARSLKMSPYDWANEHVVQLRLLHELHAHVIDDAVLKLDVG